MTVEEITEFVNNQMAQAEDQLAFAEAEKNVSLHIAAASARWNSYATVALFIRRGVHPQSVESP